MRILTRYLIRTHVGPFIFALTALTGLLFLNAVAQRLESLAGKGLTWDVIGDFLYLSLPHTIALTLPMAVLVSVLYAFSELAANNEITAMKAGGIRPQRMLLPLLGVGTIVAGVMLVFNNWILPEANHELKLLLLDINRKSPTFSLREQVMNEIRTDESGNTYWLTAARIDNPTSELFDVTIHDVSRPLMQRTTYAERGVMAFNEARTDLYLTLFDGVVYETRRSEPERFQQVFFSRQILPLRGVGNELQRRQGGADRSDREMSIGMLEARVQELEEQAQGNREDNYVATVMAVRQALGLETPPPSVMSRSSGAGAYAYSRAMGSDTVSARDPILRDGLLTTRTRASTLEGLDEMKSQVRVEIHKKYTLAFACLVFVLVAAPLAVRFPRGGLGLVIAASSGIFAVYWMGLIGGESLADRGLTPPGLTMWVPNIVFTAIGLWLFRRMGKEVATSRGGGWEDLLYTIRTAIARPFRGARRA
jgi:lipopolysaccharide export system permease protein